MKKTNSLLSRINIVDGFPSFNQRDIAMTRASTYDIAWVRKETVEDYQAKRRGINLKEMN